MKKLMENWRNFMKEQSQIEETGAGGYQYEEYVINALKAAGAVGNITSGAGASAAAADADIRVNGKVYNIEVKMDGKAQMGGTSLKYVPDGIPSDDPQQPDKVTKFVLVSKAAIEDDTLTMMEEALLPLEEHIRDLIQALEVKTIPASVRVDKWVAARDAGLLKPLNVKIKRTTRFIINHYAKKGVDYIQIGGSGLFYLGNNPANLPIPQLDGDINIEIRPARGGSTLRKDGTRTASCGFRVQGRLQFKGQSPYTLDDPESIAEMLKETSSA